MILGEHSIGKVPDAALTVRGQTQSYGVFLAHYSSHKAVEEGIISLKDTDVRAKLAIIGTLGTGGLVGVSSFIYYPYLPSLGRYVKTICMLGTVLITIGLATAAASRNVWHLLATQGFVFGLGAGLIVFTLPPILPEYFDRHGGLAQGATAAAASAGGAVFSIATEKLFESIGTRKSLIVLAGINFLMCSLVSALAEPPRKYEKRIRSIATWRAFTNPVFSLLLVVNLMQPLVFAVPAMLGPEFSKALGYGPGFAAILLAINSAVGAPSRVILGFLADIFGHLNILMVGTAVFAFSTLTLWLSSAITQNKVLWILFIVAYGVVSGCFITTMNSVQKKLFGNELYYSYSGAITTVRGIGSIVGVPIAGALISQVDDSRLKGHHFTRPIVYVGSLVMVSLICLVAIRILDAIKTGWKLKR
ncbi:MFS general substrate transporter [Corynespora cassiicola Philippines]|uniref:MFS general substrate transporter n=1 Tax=Corynespora cassiicola Philippines TaxID=1448308 RepID=A0A2T2NUD1_CORCC|nr:MFS general substrate transporter [Corynespora cassiicola Philippines]